MKGLVATTAVLGALAIGGLPALALTLAVEESGPAAEPATTLVEETATDEDPPARDAGPGWARGATGPPPGWVRNHDGRSPHGWAVREWAHCRSGEADLSGKPDASRSGPQGRPQGDCGQKPVSPGKAKKATGRPHDDQPPGRGTKPEKKSQSGRTG